MPLTNQVIAIGVAFIAAVLDIIGRRIPNTLVLAASALAFLMHQQTWGLPGFGIAAAGVGLAVLIYGPIYHLHGMSAGHLKLMMALGCLLGPHDFFWLFVFSSVFNAIIGLLLAGLAGRLGATLRNVRYMVVDLAELRAPYNRNEELDLESASAFRLPYGAAVALACIASLAIVQ